MTEYDVIDLCAVYEGDVTHRDYLLLVTSDKIEAKRLADEVGGQVLTYRQAFPRPREEEK